jgi:phage gpG-like protein
MVTLRWSVWGDDVIERDLLRFSERMVNPQPALLALAEDMRDALQEQFDSEGRYASGGWAPLAESTVAGKAAAGLRPEILRATDALMNSLTKDGAPGQVLKVENDQLTFGSEIFYGAFHQRGTSKMPQRRPIEFTEYDKRSWMKTLQRYMVTGELIRGAA